MPLRTRKFDQAQGLNYCSSLKVPKSASANVLTNIMSGVVEKLDQLNVVKITIRRIRIRRGCAGYCDALAPCICDS